MVKNTGNSGRDHQSKTKMGRRSRSRSRSPKRERRRSPGRDRDRRERHRSRSPHRRRRSPSPRRRSPVRRRSRSPRERDRGRDYDRRERDLVVHDYNHGQSSRDGGGPSGMSPPPHQPATKGLSNRPNINASDMEGKTEEEIEMMKIMGFGNFDTTKGKHSDGNDIYVANIQRKRRYRQYMNRRGGFNRPLDFIA